MLIFIAILGLGLLILVHELGHFLTAKAFGMRAEKFYIGFPPAAIKKQIGETEYGVGFVPLGGYVKISGMTREEEIPDEVKPRAYYAKPVWQRVVVISAGAAMNLLFAFLLFFFVYWQAGVPEYQATSTVASIQKDSGAEAAGLQPGDRIVSVNGVSSDDLEALRGELRAHPDQPVTVVIEREGNIMTLAATTGRNPDTGDGQLGFGFDSERIGTVKLPLTESLTDASKTIVSITREVFVIIKDLFVSEQAREELSSPVGIVIVSSKTIEMGWGVYFMVLGFISLQLAIINLLPLLPLDGGHVLFNILEKIKGSPVRKDLFERISFVGLALIVFLLVIGVSNDIERAREDDGFEIQR